MSCQPQLCQVFQEICALMTIFTYISILQLTLKKSSKKCSCQSILGVFRWKSTFFCIHIDYQCTKKHGETIGLSLTCIKKRGKIREFCVANFPKSYGLYNGPVSKVLDNFWSFGHVSSSHNCVLWKWAQEKPGEYGNWLLLFFFFCMWGLIATNSQKLCKKWVHPDIFNKSLFPLEIEGMFQLAY